LKISDNSGAKWSKCVRVVVGSPTKAGMGDLILVTLSGFSNRKKVKKRVIYLGLIISVQY
jgi:ribosomal protein L14